MQTTTTATDFEISRAKWFVTFIQKYIRLLLKAIESVFQDKL